MICFRFSGSARIAAVEPVLSQLLGAIAGIYLEEKKVNLRSKLVLKAEEDMRDHLDCLRWSKEAYVRICVVGLEEGSEAGEETTRFLEDWLREASSRFCGVCVIVCVGASTKDDSSDDSNSSDSTGRRSFDFASSFGSDSPLMKLFRPSRSGQSAYDSLVAAVPGLESCSVEMPLVGEDGGKVSLDDVKAGFPSINKRVLLSTLSKALTKGFELKIERYRGELRKYVFKDETSFVYLQGYVEGVRGLAALYAKVSMFEQVLALFGELRDIVYTVKLKGAGEPLTEFEMLDKEKCLDPGSYNVETLNSRNDVMRLKRYILAVQCHSLFSLGRPVELANEVLDFVVGMDSSGDVFVVNSWRFVMCAEALDLCASLGGADLWGARAGLLACVCRVMVRVLNAKREMDKHNKHKCELWTQEIATAKEQANYAVWMQQTEAFEEETGEKASMVPEIFIFCKLSDCFVDVVSYLKRFSEFSRSLQQCFRKMGRNRSEATSLVDVAMQCFKERMYEEAEHNITSVYSHFKDEGWGRLYVDSLKTLAICQLKMNKKASFIRSCWDLMSETLEDEQDFLFWHRNLVQSCGECSVRVHSRLAPLLLPSVRVEEKQGIHLIVLQVLSRLPVDLELAHLTVEMRDGSGKAFQFRFSKVFLAAGKLTRLTRLNSNEQGEYHVEKVVGELGSLTLSHFWDTSFDVKSLNISFDGGKKREDDPFEKYGSKITLSASSPVGSTDVVNLVRSHDPTPLLVRLENTGHLAVEEIVIWAVCEKASVLFNESSTELRNVTRYGEKRDCGSPPKVSFRQDDAVVLRNCDAGYGFELQLLIVTENLAFGGKNLDVIVSYRLAQGTRNRPLFFFIPVNIVRPFSVNTFVLKNSALTYVLMELTVNMENVVLRLRSTRVVFSNNYKLVAEATGGVRQGIKGTVMPLCVVLRKIKNEKMRKNAKPELLRQEGLTLCLDYVLSSGEEKQFKWNIKLNPFFNNFGNELENGFGKMEGAKDETEERASLVDWICQRGETSRSLDPLSVKTLFKTCHDNLKDGFSFDLRGNKLGPKGFSVVGEGLAMCGAHITILDLDSNHILCDGAVNLAKALVHCGPLKQLVLSRNGIRTKGLVALFESLQRNARKVFHLDLSCNFCHEEPAFTSLCEYVATSAALSKLGLWNSFLSTEGLCCLFDTLAAEERCHLKSLNVGCNRMTPVACERAAEFLFTNPLSLNFLCLWYCRMGTDGFKPVAKALALCKHLRRLDLRENGLDDRGAELFAVVLEKNDSLAEVLLQGNSIGDLGIGTLSGALDSNYSMVKLIVVENLATKVSALPALEKMSMYLKRNWSFSKQMQTSSTTTVFKADSQGLLRIPPQIVRDEAKVITVLNLEGNNVSALPRSFSLLENMISVNLSNNCLVDISPVSGMKKLRVLRVNGNMISHLPASVPRSCQLLEQLEMEGNKLAEFPDVSCLAKLVKLNLASNAIPAIPSRVIAGLVSLKTLDVSNNCITYIPVEVSKLKTLRVFHFRDNLIDMLPAALGRQEYDSFECEGNPLACIPRSTVSKGSRAVLYYLKDLLGGQDHFYRMKLLVTGQENVGKTTLLSALKNEVGGVNKMLRLLTGKGRRKSTQGIELEDWQPANSIITFSTWDFGGQLVYYSTHQFFLSKRSLYLVVFDLVKGVVKNRLLSWLNSIQGRAPGVHVVLVGTHLDNKVCTPEHVAKLSQQVKYTILTWQKSFDAKDRIVIHHATEGCWFYPVSSLQGTGIKDLRLCLLDLAADQKSMREKVPMVYLKFLDVVRVRRASEKLPIISWDKLKEWGGFENDAQFRRAMQLLHDWGELICFQDSSLLGDVVVLSPQWLTRVFATVLDAEEESDKDVKGGKKRGLIEREDLPRLWAAYDSENYGYFIKLLEVFEVWIALDGGERFLVPCLLGGRAPEDGFEAQSIHFSRRLLLPFPLQGFFERILVQLLKLFAWKRHWKNGAVMEKDGVLLVVNLEEAPSKSAPLRRVLELKVGSKKEGEEKEARYQTACEMLTSVMLVIHNFFQDWYSESLREQLRFLVECPSCFAPSFELDQLVEMCMRNNEEKVKEEKEVKEEKQVIEEEKVEEEKEVKEEEKQEDNTQVEKKDDPVSGLAKDKEELPPLRVLCPRCGEGFVVLEQLVPEVRSPVAVGYEREVEGEEFFASGSRSLVYRARWRGEEVAVKKLKVGRVTLEWFLSFCQEISMLSKIKHKYLVAIRAAYLRPLSIVMELVGGGTLYAHLSRMRGPQDWPLLRGVALNVGEGMAHLHSLRPPIFHRDLKSPNVLVCSLRPGADPLVKIADLGSSCEALGRASGRAVENPRWKPPELCRDRDALFTGSCDVYSFGILLYELAERSRPFADMEWPSEIEERITQGERPRITAEYKKEYLDLMERCWGQDASGRPSFSEICRELADDGFCE